MPQGFYFPTRAAEFGNRSRSTRREPRVADTFWEVIARAKSGITVERARAEMKRSRNAWRRIPQNSANESAEVILLHEQVVGRIRPALLTLLGAVGVVILIACANVANLLLVRASVRGKEIAIRAALGAGKQRLVSQMLAESLVLSITGGALGLLLAYLVVQPIKSLSAGSIPRVDDVSIDLRVLLFTLAISLVTGVLFGLAPAWHRCVPGLASS